MATLVIGAHPDDEVLGVGGTISKLIDKENEPIYVLIITDGSSTQYKGDAEKRKQKNAELQNSCSILGIAEFVHGNFPDMQLDNVPHSEINDFISKHITKWKPNVVYTHFPDINMDHKRIFESTIVATRPIQGSVVKKLILYPTPSATEWSIPIENNGFNANEYVGLEERYINKKIEAFRAYKTEIRSAPHPRSIETIKCFAQASGAKVGYSYAEEFMVIRNIW